MARSSLVLLLSCREHPANVDGASLVRPRAEWTLVGIHLIVAVCFALVQSTNATESDRPRTFAAFMAVMKALIDGAPGMQTARMGLAVR